MCTLILPNKSYDIKGKTSLLLAENTDYHIRLQNVYLFLINEACDFSPNDRPEGRFFFEERLSKGPRKGIKLHGLVSKRQIFLGLRPRPTVPLEAASRLR